MDLVPWKTGRQSSMVDSLRQEFNQLFDRFWSGQLEPMQLSRWMPAVDISETSEEVRVRAEVPGIDPSEIEVSVEANVLTIKGEKKEQREEGRENYHRVERQYGTFVRSIQLPTEIAVDQVEAAFRNGVLDVRLPKHESARAKQIKIDVRS